MTESAAQVRVIEESPAYWRIVFDNPPLNIVGASMFAGLQNLLARMDASPNLRVAVFDGETAERYGYVNRALPSIELDGFVDALARRIASFDRHPIAAAKNLINQVSLPSADRLLDSLTSFTTALTWPEAQQRFQALFKRGWNEPGDMENRYSELLGTLMDG